MARCVLIIIPSHKTDDRIKSSFNGNTWNENQWRITTYLFYAFIIAMWMEVWVYFSFTNLFGGSLFWIIIGLFKFM